MFKTESVTDLLRREIAEKKFLIVSHRGFWGGNIIQNTAEASLLAFRAGADVAELDVCRSADGVYYLFHDGEEERLLGFDRPFGEWTSAELDRTQYLNAADGPSGKYPERLETYLDRLPEGVLVNVDRCRDYLADEGFLKLIIKSGKERQLLFKTPADDAALENLRKLPLKLNWFPVLRKASDFARFEALETVSLLGAELVIRDFGSDLLSEAFRERLKAYPLLLLNAEHVGTDNLLFGGLSDDQSLTDGPEACWGKMLELGATLIQTDWPNFLAAWRAELR